jgi:ubiquinone/menaquinone biosynthesis C-methylase UbiE
MSTAPVGDPSEGLGGGLWDSHAQWWKQTFTAGADPEYEHQILPLVVTALRGCRRLLDVGTGEGQVARALQDGAGLSGVSVVGIDPSRAQLANALSESERGADHGVDRRGSSPAGSPVYLASEGEQLPFVSRCFDGAVCCLVIEHVRDPTALVREVARVLGPAGRFLLLINHPLLQGPESGLVDDTVLEERYWRVGPYLSESVTYEEVDHGVYLPFRHRPLSDYINDCCEAGLSLVRFEEPPPPASFLVDSLAPELEAAIPRLASLLFQKR